MWTRNGRGGKGCKGRTGQKAVEAVSGADTDAAGPFLEGEVTRVFEVVESEPLAYQGLEGITGVIGFEKGHGGYQVLWRVVMDTGDGKQALCDMFRTHGNRGAREYGTYPDGVPTNSRQFEALFHYSAGTGHFENEMESAPRKTRADGFWKWGYTQVFSALGAFLCQRGASLWRSRKGFRAGVYGHGRAATSLCREGSP